MDCDMLCQADIAELWNLRHPDYRIDGPAVKVVKHDYQSSGTKFLREKQIPYERKNWSSVMIFDNKKCRQLTPKYVNSVDGLDLHRFKWLEDSQIGDLPPEWNYLVGHSKGPAKLIHYTLGGPYFKDYATCEYSDEWFREKRDLDGCFENSGQKETQEQPVRHSRTAQVPHAG